MIRFKRDDGTEYPKWNNVARLEDISEFITKGATPTTYGFEWQSEGIPFFRNDSIKENRFVYGDFSYISEEANRALSRSEIKGGDILIAITGDIGKVAIVPKEIKKANINQHTARIRVKSKAVAGFVYQYLCSPNVQNEYKRIKTGFSMPQLSLVQIRDTNIPDVNIEEQQKIADFLSDVDNMIKESENEVKALEELKKGAMQKIFSQEVRFKDDSGNEYPDWEEKEMKKMGTVVTGNTPPTKDEDNYGGHTLWVTPTDISSSPYIYDTARKLSKIGEKRARLLPENSVLVTCIASIGKNCILSQTGSCNQQINAVIPFESTNSYFLLNAISFNKNKLEMLGGNGAMRIVTKSLFEEFSVSIPCLEEQQKIADFLSDFDTAIEESKKELENWKLLKKGLLQQMF